MKHEIHYQSTDLDLRAPLDLALLADSLTSRGLFLYHAGQWHDGSWSARFTVSSGFREPDKDAAAILTAIESLDEPSQRLWAACMSRDFNIGYQCGEGPWGFNQQLSAATLTRIAAAGTGLVITIYPVLDTEAVEAAVDILKKDKRIKRSIGKYQSLGIHHLDSFSIKKNQAEVKVTLTGNKGAMYVHCLMQLTLEGEWAIKEILKEEERFPPTTT
jgi:hypothetical protein